MTSYMAQIEQNTANLRALENVINWYDVGWCSTRPWQTWAVLISHLITWHFELHQQGILSWGVESGEAHR
jgi:hypothetical protein